MTAKPMLSIHLDLGPVKPWKKIPEIADRDCYPTKNVDNYAGHFEFGEGEEVLRIFAHMDVVPAGRDWDTDPTHQLSKTVALCAVELQTTRGLQQLVTMVLKIIKELGLPT